MMILHRNGYFERNRLDTILFDSDTAERNEEGVFERMAIDS